MGKMLLIGANQEKTITQLNSAVASSEADVLASLR